MSSRPTPRSRQPTLSPAWPSSRILRNISTPVTTVEFVSSWMPTIWTVSPVWTTPRSTRPDAPVLGRVGGWAHALRAAALRGGAAAGDREHVLDRHQERAVERPLGLRDV